MKRLLIAVASFAALVLAQAARADDPYAHARQLYNTYCVQCHGVNRNGKGVNTPDMPVQPRDHTDAKGMGGIPDDEIFHAIRDGGLSVNKSVLMPNWGDVLSETDIKELVVYLRHVCKCGNTK